MPRRTGLVVSAMLLVCSCATRPPPAPLPRLHAERPARNGDASAKTERMMLSRYTRDRDCAGAAYSRAHEYAAARMDELASAPTETGHIGDATANGRFRVRLAEVAARKKCIDVARSTYQDVVDVFTGPPYTTLRQRALSALASLDRSAQARPSPPDGRRPEARAPAE